MKRRDFLARTGAIAASATLSPMMFANAQNATYKFGMVTSWTSELDARSRGATHLARVLNEITCGVVEVEVFPANAQVGGYEVYDSVASGAFEMGHTASYYSTSEDPTHGFFTSVPFGLDAQQQTAWLISGGGQDLWNEINARDGLIAFPAGNAGPQMGGWFQREINRLEDLEGLTMHVFGLGGEVLRRAGANVEVVPIEDIFDALVTQGIDAAEGFGPYEDAILRLYQGAPFYYAPGWHAPGPTLGAYMNLDLFESLPRDIKDAIVAASHAVNQKMLADANAENGPALAELVSEGAQLRTFPHEVLRALETTMNEIHDENAVANSLYARVLEAFTTFRDQVRGWHAVTEVAYDAYVYGNDET